MKASASEPFQPLEGIKVIDISKVLAGPLCGQILGDLGADVIKVESLTGDDTRGWPPMVGDSGAVYMAANRNKRSICLNLKTTDGKEILQRLLAESDVLIENYRTGAMERLGLGYDDLVKTCPRLIYTSVSGFGRDGPMASDPGYDLLAQAFSSIMHMTGERDGAPVRATFSPMDQGTGMWAVIGILAALRERDQTGRGKHIDVSLFETGLGLIGYLAQGYWQTGRIPERRGSQHESLCPYQAFSASDGMIVIGIGNDSLFQRYCALVGREDVSNDPRFSTNRKRVENFDETIRFVSEVTLRKTVAEWMSDLSRAGIPNSPINTIADALSSDQASARRIALEYDHPDAGPLKTVGLPILFSGERLGVRHHPPRLGEHSDEVLSDLGIQPHQIEHLRSTGVVR